MRLHEHTSALQLQFSTGKNRALLIFRLNKKKHGIYTYIYIYNIV